MNDTMTEGEFSKYLESATAFGGSPKVLLVRCTCPRPEDCACPEPDEEGSIDPCPACIAMVHTAPDCMIQVMTNWDSSKPWDKWRR